MLLTLIGAAGQSAYLISAADPSSKGGVPGLIDMAEVNEAAEVNSREM